MSCFNGLSPTQQVRVVEWGNLPIGYIPEGECENGAAVAIEVWGDEKPGPRFYCLGCAVSYLQSNEVRVQVRNIIDMYKVALEEVRQKMERDVTTVTPD